MLEKWEKLFLYGGLTKEQFISIQDDICQQNQRDLRAYCAITALLLGISAPAVWLTSAFTLATVVVYCIGFTVSLLLFFLSLHCGQSILLQILLKYTFILITYSFGILVSLAQPDSISVIFMVILVVVRLIFSGQPIVIAVFTVDAAAIFLACEVLYKDPEIVTVDTWNTVTYSMLAILVGVIMQRVRLQNLLHLRDIAVLSESDLLTGLKNRNSFEHFQVAYSNIKIMDVACIYADVNGLHEVNNTHGHKAGDLMLQTVAQAILRQYGRDHSYRVGGDEFVTFAFGKSPEKIRQQIAEIKETCLQKGYYVSFGFACGKNSTESLDSLVRRAEESMYADKAEYYRTHGHDRRRNRSES